MKNGRPFLWGAQYYRAPTPEKDCWEQDLRRMRKAGFDAVKFWVQWRWSNRERERFDFSDLDELMDLSLQHGLSVTLNIILDVAPSWLFREYPDALQITDGGEPVLPRAVASRQIGGFPGPCYSHPAARSERRRFLEKTVEHFRNHPALGMWDVWNEPEQCGPYRSPEAGKLVCYCEYCRSAFVEWLQRKYRTIGRLNALWGRCYSEWDEVELPRTPEVILDFIDFREFRLDLMSGEAQWRILCTKNLDQNNPVYLHVVPNTMRIFNSISGVDDFSLAQNCDVFGATTFAAPVWPLLTVSAGRGKICYSAECHIAHGSIRMHQKPAGLQDLVRELVPQIGAGIRGFLFWQFRAETLGTEAPAWGIVRPDGSDRPLTAAVESFRRKLDPYLHELTELYAPEALVGIWVSRKNEIFHFSGSQTTGGLADSLEAYIDFFYWNNYSLRVVNSESLERGDLGSIKLLVMPSCYCLTAEEAASLDRWVRESGGVLFCEAHLGGYNASLGRHSRVTPGFHLAEAWGIREVETTSPRHLNTGGEKYVPVTLPAGDLVWGAERFAVLESSDAEQLGSFSGLPCIIRKQVGNGTVVYCGTNPGEGAVRDRTAFGRFLRSVCDRAGIYPPSGFVSHNPGAVHLDLLSNDERLRALVLHNRTDSRQTVELQYPGRFRGIFTGFVIEAAGKGEIVLDAGFCDLFIREQG